MEILKAVLLGIAQGVTEFLPISSSGHLLLLEKAGLGEPSLFYNVLLHAGSLAAVVIIYRKKLWELIRHPIKSEFRWYVLASVPTAALALVFKYFFEGALLGSYLPLGFMMTAVALSAIELFKKKSGLDDRIGTLNTKNSLFTGVFQGIAVLPGASRSGLTLAALTLSGVEREKALEFSFLLSVPIILASAAFELASGGAVSAPAFLPSALGVAAAFISGLLAIKFMLRIIRKKPLWAFAAYTFFLSLAILIIQASKV